MRITNESKNPFDGIKRASNERNETSLQGASHLSHKNFNDVSIGTQVVGKVLNGVFTKRVRSSRHFLRKPPAIALDIDTVEQALRLGATKVEVYDMESGMFYRAKIDLIFEKGFRFNRGFGDQIALCLSRWEIEQTDQGKQSTLWGAR